MAKGQPDFGALAPTETIVGLSDMGELAARLGSILTFDRRGNVIFIEDFNGSLSKCVAGASGSGGGVSISNEWSRHGDFSCKMVTGNKTDDYSFVDVYIPYQTLSKVGMEICWYPEIYIKDFELYILLYDGAKRWWFAVRWHYENSTWQYCDNAGNWISLSPAVANTEGCYIFNQVKLVIDLANKEYVRLIANNLTWDLTGKAVQWANNLSAAHLLCEVSPVTKTDDSCIVYLDNMIITQNEP